MKSGWETKRLGDVATLQRGFDLPTQDRVSGEYQLVSSSGVIDTHHKSAVGGPGVVTGRSGSIGNVFFVEEDFWPLNTVLYVKDFHGNDPRFVFHLLKKFDLKRFATGTGVPTLNRNFVHDELVYVPPLPEQLRIVGILDEAFDGIATAKANAEKNLQNARTLFESHLQSVFTQRGEGWVEKPLEKAAAIINGFAFKSTDFSPKGVVKSIKITNVGVREFVCESDCNLPEDFDTKYVAVSVQKGSIVIALTRTIISGGLKVAVVPDEYNGALLNQRVAAIATYPDMLTVPFLFAYLSTQAVVDYVKERVNTLMQPNLSITDLRSMPIPLPTVQEQNAIANHLDELRDETQRLESIYQQKLAALDALKKSLLDQAFTGQL